MKLPTIPLMLISLVVASPVHGMSMHLDFEDDQIPAGWTLHYTTDSTDAGVSGGRFVASEVDNGGYLEHALDPLGASGSVSFEWDGSLFRSYWGNFSGVRLVDRFGSDHAVQIGAATHNWQNTNQLVLRSGGTTEETLLSLPDGTYRFGAQFSGIGLSFTGTLAGERQFLLSLNRALDMTSMVAIRLHVYETVGPPMWIDNVTVSAVPTPASGWMMFAGLASVLVLRRRQ